MTRTRILLFVLPALAMLSLASCAGGHSGEKYVFISTNVKIPYWQTASAGFYQSADELKVGYEFTGPDSYNASGEKDELDRAISAKPNGILISVADANVLQPSIDRAIAAGIPVITMDSDAPSSKRLFFIGTNNYQAGVEGGKRLAQELKGKGNVVVFAMPSQPNQTERLRGYKDALDSSPQIKIVHVVDMKGDSRITFDSTTQFLANDKKEHINAFVCLEALSGKEVAAVLNNNSIKDRVVIAMDTDPDTLDWIKKGVISATIAQKPYTMGFVGLKMLDTVHHQNLPNLGADWKDNGFSPIPDFVDTGSEILDKSNVDAFESATKNLTGK